MLLSSKPSTSTAASDGPWMAGPSSLRRALPNAGLERLEAAGYKNPLRLACRRVILSEPETDALHSLCLRSWPTPLFRAAVNWLFLHRA